MNFVVIVYKSEKYYYKNPTYSMKIVVHKIKIILSNHDCHSANVKEKEKKNTVSSKWYVVTNLINNLEVYDGKSVAQVYCFNKKAKYYF